MDTLARGKGRGRGSAIVGQPQAPLIARAQGRAEQGPGEVHQVLVGQRPEPAQQRGPTLGAGQVAHRPGPAGELVEEIQVRQGQAGLRAPHPRLAGGRDLCHQLQALQHARRQHRPDHHGQRREVPAREQRRERQRKRRQQRAVGPDARRQWPQLPARRRGPLPDHDPDRLAAALPKRNEDRLARLQVLEAGRHEVGVGSRPGSRGGIHRHLDEPPPGRRGCHPARVKAKRGRHGGALSRRGSAARRSGASPAR